MKFSTFAWSYVTGDVEAFCIRVLLDRVMGTTSLLQRMCTRGPAPLVNLSVRFWFRNGQPAVRFMRAGRLGTTEHTDGQLSGTGGRVPQ